MTTSVHETGTQPLLSVRNLRVSFRLDKSTMFEAVKGVSFDIPRNSTVALVGESGSGKSVTSLSILGLLPPENSHVRPGSEILYGGRNFVGLSRRKLAVALERLGGRAQARAHLERYLALEPTSSSWAEQARSLIARLA